LSSTNNAQYLMTINKNSIIGTSYLTSVTIDNVIKNIVNDNLGVLLYSRNVI
jgi:hypothetical protein